MLLDAYNYFVNSVFPTPPSGAPDPAIDCRNYIIVYVTDGHDECSSDPCVGGTTGLGPSGDLGQVALPESVPGSRTSAHAADPSVRVTGIPVFVVGLNSDPSFFPALNCIATNSGGQLFAATDRGSLQAALESILDFKRNANFFAAPAVPAFSGGIGDTAQIGAVIPSHLNPNGDLSSWAVWSGSLKSFQLDSGGFLPTVTAPPATPSDTPTPGGPTATPVVGTPTPTPVPGSTGTFIDESDPDDSNPANRKPVWNAGRVLGYTDPVANLAENASPVAASPAARAPAITRVARPQDGVLAGNGRRAVDALRLPPEQRNLHGRRHAGRVLRRPHDRHGSDPDVQRREPDPREADRAVPPRRHLPVRKPRRSPERSVHPSAHDRRDRPERGSGAEVLLLLPGRSGRAGEPAAGQDGRRRQSAGGLCAQARRHLPLRAAAARAAAVLSVPRRRT